jgi:PAS domain S-box-containing protein
MKLHMPSSGGTVSPANRNLAPSTFAERWPVLLLLLGAGTVAMLAARPSSLLGEPSRVVSGALALLAGTTCAAGVLSVVASRPGASPRARWLAVGLALSGLLQVGAWVGPARIGRPATGGLLAASVSVLLAAFLGALVVDFFEQVHEDRRELIADVGLVSILTGAAVYLLLHGYPTAQATVWGFVLTAGIAASAILLSAGHGILALRSTSLIHAGLFACSAIIGGSAILLDYAIRFDLSAGATAGPETAAGLTLVAVAGLVYVQSLRAEGARPASKPATWIRTGLLALSFVAMTALFVVAIVDRGPRVRVGETVVIAVLVMGAVAGRTLMMQIAMVRSASQLGQALAEREAAIESLQSAVEVVATSEARMRLLLDSAVDGIVELDSNTTIVRANGAFGAMVRMPLSQIVGRRWDELVASAGEGRETLAALPDSGEATLSTDVGTTYLEGRSSPLPTSPPGSLLLIRDVTSSKVAEQTIRTLFQFLQDRDEDRTRLLRRTDSAIEAERNRIARDLHDGPIQGISAAALSLEAVKLMLEAGDGPRAGDMLQMITTELSEEAIGLRRIMKDLRPPVLEQRGLVPAVRELCARAGRELDVEVNVAASEIAPIPSDVETLAYRVIQEALSNVYKHAGATQVTVRIGANAGTLQVDIADDGRGFDAAHIREFLAQGKVGLASMRERAELARGILTVRSEPGKGTTVSATIPFEILGVVPASTG